MLKPGPAKKVTVHLNEDTSVDSNFIYEQVVAFLLDQGVAGATLIRPQQGFGQHRHLHSQEGHGAQRQHLPVQVQFIESYEAVQLLLPRLSELIADGLIEMHDTTILKAAKQEASF